MPNSLDAYQIVTPANEVLVLDGPTITCQEHQHSTNPPPWCIHLLDAYQKGWDSQLIWRQGQLPIEIILNIPVFPSEDAWTTVQLYLVENMRRYRVEWNDKFLTFLNEGEGRLAIREVLTQQLLAVPEFEKLECQAGHHSFRAEMLWASIKDQDTPQKWANYWSVFTTKWCLFCTKNNPAGNVDDLFPAKEGGVWNA